MIRPVDAETHPDTGQHECVSVIHAGISRFFTQHIPAGTSDTSVVLAVSGGADSLCMAAALLELQVVLHIVPTIAHLNHGLRGQAADDDADFVQRFADQHHAQIILGSRDVRGIADARHLSIEAAARMARYEFLQSAAITVGANYIAVAHNADDQAETVLLRLIRGSGVAGLQGMRSVSLLHVEYTATPSRILLLRPLLGVSREQIECYCRSNQLQPRRDETNDELHHARNRIRHELLPLLRQYNPGIRTVLARLAETAATDMEVIDYATSQIITSLLLQDEAQRMTLDRLAWRKLPVGLQRTVIRECVKRFAGDMTDLKYAGIEEARAVLNSDAQSGEIAILADVRIHVKANRFWFERLAADLL